MEASFEKEDFQTEEMPKGSTDSKSPIERPHSSASFTPTISHNERPCSPASVTSATTRNERPRSSSSSSSVNTLSLSAPEERVLHGYDAESVMSRSVTNRQGKAQLKGDPYLASLNNVSAALLNRFPPRATPSPDTFNTELTGDVAFCQFILTTM